LRNSFLFGLGQIAVVVAGVGFGSSIDHQGDPPNLFTMLGFLALAFLTTGAVVATQNRSPAVGLLSPFGGGAVALYCAFVMKSEPFLHPPTEPVGLLPLMVWFFPLPVAGMGFARLRCWWLAAGTSVFLFCCVGMLTFNMNWVDMAGFLVKIRR
jgi:hypothetical protein